MQCWFPVPFLLSLISKIRVCHILVSLSKVLQLDPKKIIQKSTWMLLVIATITGLYTDVQYYLLLLSSLFLVPWWVFTFSSLRKTKGTLFARPKDSMGRGTNENKDRPKISLQVAFTGSKIASMTTSWQTQFESIETFNS